MFQTLFSNSKLFGCDSLDDLEFNISRMHWHNFFKFGMSVYECEFCICFGIPNFFRTFISYYLFFKERVVEAWMPERKFKSMFKIADS